MGVLNTGAAECLVHSADPTEPHYLYCTEIWKKVESSLFLPSKKHKQAAAQA